jgi:hypothetical protein
MSEAPTRRAALGALASAPALAVLPVAGSAFALAATASPAHPDAALFAMQSAIEAADGELDAAFVALEPAENAFFAKEPDAPMLPDCPVFSAEEQQALDAFAAKTRAAQKRGRLPVLVAYYQAVQDYEGERERLKVECGVTAAERMQNAAQDTISGLSAVLAATPATTLAGLIFKARYAATHYSDDYDDGVMISIVDDLMAMAGQEEGFADA